MAYGQNRDYAKEIDAAIASGAPKETVARLNAERNEKIAANNRYIRGYGLPDYASMSESPPPTVAPEPHTVGMTPQTNGGRLRAMDNAGLAAFLQNPPPLAVGQSWLDWLNAPAL